MKPTDISCKKCGGQLTAESVIEDEQAIRCGHCQAIFTFEPDGPKKKSAKRPRKKVKVKLPKELSLIESDHELVITRKWYSTASPLMLILFVGMILALSNKLGFHPYAFFLIVPLSYLLLTCFVNSTVVRVSAGVLSVKTGPLPWYGNLELEANLLEQLYAVERE